MENLKIKSFIRTRELLNRKTYIFDSSINGNQNIHFNKEDLRSRNNPLLEINQGRFSLVTKNENNVIEEIISNQFFDMNSQNKESINITRREKEVLILIGNGMKNQIIADNMNISKETVNSYIDSLLYKFSAKNRTDLFVKALNEKKINIEEIKLDKKY